MREDIQRIFEEIGQSEVASTLDSIELAVWLIFGLLLLAAIAAYVRYEVGRQERAKQQPDWKSVVERAYDSGNYQRALQTLETKRLLFPGSALILFWQGRCHFRLEEWEKAAEKFEACVRLEPYYRESARDYMAFIELNELVPGVEGYLDK